MKTNFALLFYLRKQKTWNKGPVPIYIHITVNGRRSELSAGRSCEISRWNSDAGRGIGTKEESRMLNTYLDTIQTKIRITHQMLLERGEPITSESLKNQLSSSQRRLSSYHL